MGLLEKLKNTFFEEEYVELEEEKEEKVAQRIEDKKLKDEETLEEIKPLMIEDEEDEILDDGVKTYSDNELVNQNNKIDYFDDEDFEAKPVVKEEPKRIYGETSDKLYSSINIEDLPKYNMPNHKAYGAKENTFEPTPIISPIYGILDKNYRKEEVVDKKDRLSSYVSRKDVDLDSVRRKAYGEDMATVEVKEEVEEDNNGLYDTNFDNKPVVDTVTVADAEEYFNDLGLEYNVDYKDAHYENATGRRSDAYKEEENFEPVSDIEETEETMDDIVNNNVDDDEANLGSNLFDLVDSVYEDGE